MVTDIFIDGASEVSVHNGIVRINLVTLAATEKDAKGQPVREVRHRLIMSAKATTELYAHLEATLKRLAEAGIVTRKEPQTAQRV
jgi:hypothetical protein